MIKPKITFLLLAFGLLAVTFTAPMVANADHSAAHCRLTASGGIDSDSYIECESGIPNTTAEWSAYCVGLTGSENNADYTGCMLENNGGEGGAADPVDPVEPTPGEGTGGFSLDQGTGELSAVEQDIQDNPIYVRLIEIVNFLSVGVGIVSTISVAIAGIQYTTSRGEPAKTAAAVNRLIQVGVAVFLYVFGWTIINWIIPGGVL